MKIGGIMNKRFFTIAAILVFIGGMYYFMRDRSDEIKNIGNTNQTIVAFGDSLTRGYGAGSGQSYPELLSIRLGRDVINLGRNGETAAHAPSRLQEVLDYQPHMVLIEFGANDFMQGRSFEAAVNAISHIVDEVQKAGAIAVIVDTGGAVGMKRYSRAYKKLAKEKGAVFVSGILDGIFNKQQYKSDMVHPNAAGYSIVADRVYEAIIPYLK